MGARSHAAILMASAFVAVLHVSTREARSQAAACLVSTANGDVQGIDRGASCAFLGVPYAAPPVGALRWRPPQPAAPWAPAALSALAAPNCAAFSAATGLPAGSRRGPVVGPRRNISGFDSAGSSRMASDSGSAEPSAGESRTRTSMLPDPRAAASSLITNVCSPGFSVADPVVDVPFPLASMAALAP